MKLQDFTDAQLLAEVGRRLARASGEFRPCTTCARFRPGGYGAPDSYNPCQAGHDMEFRMPDDSNFPDADEWGFTRPGCESREEAEPDPAPAMRRPSLRRV